MFVLLYSIVIFFQLNLKTVREVVPIMTDVTGAIASNPDITAQLDDVGAITAARICGEQLDIITVEATITYKTQDCIIN